MLVSTAKVDCLPSMTYWFHPEVQGTVAQMQITTLYIDVSLQTYGGVWMKAIDESSWTWEVGMNTEDKFNCVSTSNYPMRFTRAHKGHTQGQPAAPRFLVSISAPQTQVQNDYIVNGEERKPKFKRNQRWWKHTNSSKKDQSKGDPVSN